MAWVSVLNKRIIFEDTAFPIYKYSKTKMVNTTTTTVRGKSSLYLNKNIPLFTLLPYQFFRKDQFILMFSIKIRRILQGTTSYTNIRLSYRFFIILITTYTTIKYIFLEVEIKIIWILCMFLALTLCNLFNVYRLN